VQILAENCTEVSLLLSFGVVMVILAAKPRMQGSDFTIDCYSSADYRQNIQKQFV
jgi:hypothetical protein